MYGRLCAYLYIPGLVGHHGDVCQYMSCRHCFFRAMSFEPQLSNVLSLVPYPFYLFVAIFPQTILAEFGGLCINGLRVGACYRPVQIAPLLIVSMPSMPLVDVIPAIPICSCDCSVSVLSAPMAPSSCCCSL
jgi:hypothetical protein